MRTILIILLMYLLPATAVCGEDERHGKKYKPKTLDEAIAQLDVLYDDTTKHKIRSMTEDDFTSNAHMGTGMWMRNNWGLWRRGKLAKHFDSMGIHHPDDMSGIILTSYHRYVMGKDRGLEQQVKSYRDYWSTTTLHFERLKTDTAYQRQVKQTQDSLATVALNKKKLEWTAGKKVSGYVDKRCDLLGDFLKRTKIEGDILGWNGDKLVLKVTKYYDEKSRKRIIKCNHISDDILIVSDHDMYVLETQGAKE